MFYRQDNDSYIECVKSVGQYVIDNAEEIAGDLNKENEISITLVLDAGCLPEIEIRKKKRVPKVIYKK